MIDLPASQLETVRHILSAHVPDCEVRAFGSRIGNAAKAWSDLDLAVVGNSKLEKSTLFALKEAFEESDLPIRVDVLDWHTISPEFKAVVEAGYEVVQKKDGLARR
ncbi:MAG: nucleotidyltransferase domain-containing protein [Verrucomicrobiota bacterium]